ncbi:hypothetical protein GEMRC1_002293 [Eukaryota sp. GEM-RC1]
MQNTLFKVSTSSILNDNEAYWYSQSLVLDDALSQVDSYTSLLIGDTLLYIGGSVWEFSAVGYGDQVFIFGGSSVRSLTAVSNFGLSSLFLRSITCDDFTSRGFDCKLDCFLGSQQNTTSPEICSPCREGLYGTSSGSQSICVPCPPGFFSDTIAVIGSESCLPCPAQTYQPYAGSSSCFPCSEDEYCPVGSLYPRPTNTSVGGHSISSQPRLPEPNTDRVAAVSNSILVISYILAVLVLILVAFMGANSSKLVFIDLFSRQHFTENDQVITKRKTRLGGLFSFWFIIFALAFSAILLLNTKWITLPTTGQRNLPSSSNLMFTSQET